MTAKEKLVEDLRRILDFKGHPYEGFERVADFIIEDRKRIVAPLVNLGDIYFDVTTDHKKHVEAIKQTLVNSGV